MSFSPGGKPAPTTLVFTPELVKDYLLTHGPAGQTERFRRIDRVEAHWKCCAYAHQEYDWNGFRADETETISAQLAPGGSYSQSMDGLKVRQKRPTAPLHLTKRIVNQFTGLLFSSRRIPTVKVETDEDTEAALEAVIKQSRFWARMREARNMGGGTGTVVETVGVREGRFVFEVHNPKHVTPLWRDRATHRLLGVLIEKVVPVEEQGYDEKGQPAGLVKVDYIHRRIITEAEDVHYKPVKVAPMAQLVWEEDPFLKVVHNLGFFPGVWVQNHENSEDIDGDPDCEGTWQMQDTIDRLLSQENKSALQNCDPKVEIGADASEIDMTGGLRMMGDTAINVGKSGHANLLESTGTGIEASEKVVDRLKRGIEELARVVLPDPDKVTGGAQSGVAKTIDHEPMLECADELRDQYGGAAGELLGMVVRIGASLQGKVIDVPDTIDIATGQPLQGQFVLDLPKRRIQQEDGSIALVDHVFRWPCEISLAWGPYFAPTDEDDAKRISNAVTAKTGGIVDRKTAADHVAQAFGVKDVDGMIARIREEEGEDLDRALAQGMGGGGGFGGGGGGEDDARGAGAGGGFAGVPAGLTAIP